ncbi:prepilin-type N-terminal cleavage/methylation domain-containing protein [Oscillospiraceae bacterium LCP25S3_F9]
MTNKIFYKNKKGFTTVEMVVVIAILAILAAIAVPVVNSILNTAAKNAAVANAQTLEYAIKTAQSEYVNKTTDNYPGIKNSVKPSLSDVVKVNAIESTLEHKSVYGEKYVPVWDKTSDRCLLLLSDGHGGYLLKDINGSTLPASMSYNLCQLSTESDGNYVVEKYDIVSWTSNYSDSALSL